MLIKCKFHSPLYRMSWLRVSRSFTMFFLSNYYEKFHSNFKRLGSHLLRTQVLLFLFLGISGSVLSQSIPSVRTRANQFTHNDFSHTGKRGDWFFSVFEDTKLDLVSTGYAQDSALQNAQLLSIVKTDKDLNPLWMHAYSSAKDATNKTRHLRGLGRLYEAIEYIDPDDGITYYVGAGYTPVLVITPGPIVGLLSSKFVVVKVTADGNLVSGFPRIYINSLGGNDTNDISKERRIRGVKYDSAHQKFYFVGSEDEVPCMFSLNEDLDFNSLAKIDITLGGTPLHGELKGMCFEYANGSLPGGRRAVAADVPLYVWATGLEYDGLRNNNSSDSNVLITRVALNLASQTTVSETAPSPPSPNIWVKGGWYRFAKNKVANCVEAFRNRTSGDQGHSIEQLANGNIICAGFYNEIHHRQSQFPGCMNSTPWAICDADIFAEIIDPSLFHTLNPSTYTIDNQHVGRMSSPDFMVKVREDYDNNIYFTGSTADADKVLTDGGGPPAPLVANFYVIKTDANLDSLWDQVYFGGSPNHMDCGFGATVCRNNELVINGDNDIEGENYDLVRLGRDCELNYTGFDILPNIPGGDGVTISVSQMLGGTPGTMNFGASHRFRGQLRIESGFKVTILGGQIMEFADLDQIVDRAVDNGFEYGIIIEKGGELEMTNGSILTSLAACPGKWRGVQVLADVTPNQTNLATVGYLNMTDSRIENAVTGASIEGGGLITCTNVSNLNYVNFNNCRKGVAFYPFGTANLSRFNFTNFLFTAPNPDWSGIGLNTHCSMYGVDNINFNGCTFINQYTGAYRLGIGLASFDASFFVLRGNDIITQSPCAIPIGRTPIFQNLTYGILSDKTSYSVPYSPANFIGVGESEFINCGTGWQCDNDAAPLSYMNIFTWNDDLEDYPMPYNQFGLGMWLHNTNIAKIHENTFTSDEDYPEGEGVALQNMSAFTYSSLVRKNTFQKVGGGASTFKFGVFTDGDNNLFDLRCNTFTDMTSYDWWNMGLMQAQGSLGDPCGNTFSSPGPINISTAISGAFSYFDIGALGLSTSGPVSTANAVGSPPCDPLDPCDVYSSSALGEVIGFEFENIEAPAMREEQEIWKKIKEANYSAANNLTNDLEIGNYKTLFNTVIPILEGKRLNKTTPAEIGIITNIANGEDEASIDANHFLSFFLEKPQHMRRPEEAHPVATENSAKILNIIRPEDNSNYRIYPNPTSGILNLELSHISSFYLTLDIIDVNGKLIKRYLNINSDSNQIIEIKSQTNGVYFYKLYSDNGYLKTGKIILSH
jgi:hypothetical protein